MHVRVQAVDKSQPFPYLQLGTLALCRLAEPIALASILPYAYSMVKSFEFGDPSQAGFWSGVLVSAFAICEAAVCPLWGALSDKIGRKPVLLIGMAGTMFSITLMGFATNFWIAMVARCFGGLLNGNIGVIQTMVGEICKNPEHEPRAFAMMPIVWLLGTIIGPSIAAFTIGKFFTGFPYLLPNLICALILLVAIITGWFLLQETHPDLIAQDEYNDDEVASILCTSEAYGTFAHCEDDRRIAGDDACETTSLLARVRTAETTNHDDKCTTFTRKVVMLIVALSFFAYHAMCFDSLFPILLQEARPESTESAAAVAAPSTSILPSGGLGFSQQQVGVVMSSNGVLALIVQIFLFPPLANRIGVFRLFQFSVALHPFVYLCAPLIAALPDSLTYVGLYAELVLRNLATIVLYPLILILIKEAAPKPSVLGKINGVAASCGSFPRALAPPIAGYFYGLGESRGIPGLAWWTTAVVAILGVAQLTFIKRTKKVMIEGIEADPEEVVPGYEDDYSKHPHVHVLVAEVDSD